MKADKIEIEAIDSNETSVLMRVNDGAPEPGETFIRIVASGTGGPQTLELTQDQALDIAGEVISLLVSGSDDAKSAVKNNSKISSAMELLN
ncbi:MAG: hypothetical protein ACI9R3_005021 [Verrucomicrobiales bacterium]|jgi:hypothetical protein